MSIWGTIFGSTKAVEETMKTANSVVDKAGTFIDEMFHTPEEKSDAHLKVLEFNLRAFEAAQKYNPDGKSLTRRIIVIGYAGSYLLFLYIGAILELFKIANADIFFLLVDKLEWHVTLCFYFYFGYYGVKQVGTGVLKAFYWLREKRKKKVIINNNVIKEK